MLLRSIFAAGIFCFPFFHGFPIRVQLFHAVHNTDSELVFIVLVCFWKVNKKQRVFGSGYNRERNYSQKPAGSRKIGFRRKWTARKKNEDEMENFVDWKQ